MELRWAAPDANYMANECQGGICPPDRNDDANRHVVVLVRCAQQKSKSKEDRQI